MTKKSVGEYIEEMRLRHPRLSKRKMSLEAGLSENIIRRVINGEIGILPATLKQICDRWGTEADYRELMRLAGHPLPEPELSPRVRRAAELLEKLPREKQDIVIEILSNPNTDWPTLQRAVGGDAEDKS